MVINSKDKLIQIDSSWKNFKYDKEKVYSINIKHFITDKHIDIIVKYLYVKAYIEKQDLNRYKDMYQKMQINRIGSCNIKEFNKLINSFEKEGFKKEYPIPINKKKELLNGSHRLACSLYFNINPYVVEIDKEDHEYNINWFKENGFLGDEITEILNTKESLIKEYSYPKVKLSNIYTAMVSPLNENKTLDKEYFKKHADYIYKNKIKGLFVCGNTGNGMNLTVELKKEILKEATNMKKFSIICHVGANSVNDIYKLVDITNNSNIDCIASMPPYQIINAFKDVKKFYERLAKYSKKPLLIYHIPSTTGIDFNKDELTELLEINNVIGIKYTDNNLEKLKEISEKETNKYIFFGRDDYLKDGLNNGANGGIGGCYNLFPSFVYNIINDNDREINQEKLNYCIKKLREVYPKIPGSEFVLKSLKDKKDMDDEEFYNYIRKGS